MLKYRRFNAWVTNIDIYYAYELRNWETTQLIIYRAKKCLKSCSSKCQTLYLLQVIYQKLNIWDL